ncbi:D-arabitol-phosphate dehydrogenase-like isoform X4 [Schistocerca serialis cubense]|uniref:D-arabitol-phosphate dehydrogenase-like isoform X4 n=1 Tax=Schistocerca serialis cubense TaxID=2023355 RepID=UPI00214EA719|nr:D-arabitol-phosphate dehydrogenase-like isoform X4 [Schistocerca serialis cubense]
MGDYAALQLDTRLRRLYPTRLPIMTRCPPGEVIVRVAYAGICHTDLAILQGDFQIDCDRLVLGHEISGIVSGVGKEVNWLRIGDKVAVNPNSKCERCAVCLHEEMGAPAEASVGVERDGGWAEFCLVPQSQLHLLPSDVPLKQGDAMIQQEAAHALGFGGHLLIFRSNSVKDRLCLSPFNIFTNEIKVTGSLINPYAFGKALTWASVLGHRYLDFNKLGVVSYPLKEYQEALETAKSDDAAKVVFEFDVSDVPTP